MPTRSRAQLRSRALLLLCVCLALVSSLPASSINAATIQSTIDNTVVEFSRGTFQRTALGSLQNTAASPKDLPGAVQLGPLGLLKTWTTLGFPLKKPLYKMGTTAIGNRLYVVGGITPVGNSSQPVAEVWSAPVSQANGQFLEDWRAELALKPFKGANRVGFDGLIAEVNSAGVTSVSTGGGAGYIYVIGGAIRTSATSTETFSSYTVRIGVVGANGVISDWLEGPAVPTSVAGDPTQQLGVQSAAVQAITIGGNTYIYLIGGLRRFLAGVGAQARYVDEGLKTVFYAKVSGNGQLVKPSNGAAGWDQLADLPVPGDYPTGLWDGVAMADHFTLPNGTQTDALFLVGGQTVPGSQPVFSSAIYRATFAASGALTWDGTWQGTLPQTLAGFGGVPYRGTLYATGGLPDGKNEPDRGVLTSYVEDDQRLHLFNGDLPPGVLGGGSHFLKSPDTLPAPRVFHGTALVPGDGTTTTSGFVYVIGGRGDTTDGDPGDNNGATEVFLGKIGGSEDVSTNGYAYDALYFSKPYDIDITGASLQKIYWATSIDRITANPDIELAIRRSPGAGCANAVWTDWQPIKALESDATHQSADGLNTSSALNLAARCFQYRVYLKTDSYRITPSLLNLSIDVVVPGSPDLKFKNVGALKGSGDIFLGLDILIENVNTFEQTLAADVEQRGSFFVDVCIFGPGEQVSKLELPLTNDKQQCSDAYADINRSIMGVNAVYPVKRWLASTGLNSNKSVDILSFFKTPGTYTIIASVDSYNNINEGTLGGEDNNVSQTVTFNVGKVGYALSLPITRR